MVQCLFAITTGSLTFEAQRHPREWQASEKKEEKRQADRYVQHGNESTAGEIQDVLERQFCLGFEHSLDGRPNSLGLNIRGSRTCIDTERKDSADDDHPCECHGTIVAGYE